MSKKLSAEAMAMLCDAELVSTWQEGRDEAFEVLYLRYVPGLVNLAAKKTGSRELAKEMVQDVFFDFYKRKLHLDPQGAIKAYLHHALRHRVYNYYREVMIRKKHEASIVRLQQAEENRTETDVNYHELQQLLRHGVSGLPVKCREVFVLSREEHLSNKEIASRLNISVNTVEQHMRKALQRLRGSMQHYLMWLLAMGSVFLGR
ncbi:RNA polymerase sigma-70 factor [Pedobacter sp. SYP-B3415]|uniref:RNA polymerase sigma-70 factor n=1 Tax=Pedobacter sp. SYP-B3415 TaxID=2496641 RepID=UPI00101CB490|nr:RNA polymerase sigma-70 factor [Pedobacter sp. SYP-B3415]